MTLLRPLQRLTILATCGVLAAAGLVAAAPKPGAPAKAAPSGAAPAKAAAAAGAPGQPGLLGSSNAPIDVTAENSEMFQNEHRQVFWGNVEAIQGQSRLRTPRLTTYFTPREASAGKAAPGVVGVDPGQVERVEAEGPVFYVTPTQKATGNHATYLAGPDTITLTGNVVLVQGEKDVATGDKLVIEQKTGHATLSSNAGKPGQRVRAVLYPNQNNGQAATGAAAPAATSQAPPKAPGRP